MATPWRTTERLLHLKDITVHPCKEQGNHVASVRHKSIWLFLASTFPHMEDHQSGITSANLTVNHPNILVWVIHEKHSS